MEKLNCKLKNTNNIGIFHASREDVQTLKKVFNIMHNKINELIEENNQLKKQIK